MTDHAVKEILLECLLCIEIDPQPPEWVVKWDYLESIDIFRFHGNSPMNMITKNSPIAIGDTVYQGEEWADEPGPETMPIELADKTFKVVGIEVEEREWESLLEGNIVLNPPKWFWFYKLEDI